MTKHFQAELLRRRVAATMTQTDLAEASNLSPKSISNLEGGHQSPTLSTLVKLARALGCTTADLVGSPDEECCGE